MLTRLRERNDWKFFTTLHRADLPLAVAWWSVLLSRAALPAIFGITMGLLVGAVQQGADLTTPLVAVGLTFVLLQVLTP
jgi:ATP-binding cassette subfamily B protein